MSPNDIRNPQGGIPAWQLDPVDELAVAQQHDRLLAQLFDVTVDLRMVGSYVLGRKLGEGSMGVVYAACDPTLDRMLAIKLPRLDAPELVRRFVREAKAMARVNHPNTAKIYEVGEHEGRAFIAMELISGVTLREWLAASPRSSAAILDVFLAAGRGLAAIHTKRLVHRDFKPSNVMLDEGGHVRVTDFGLVGEAVTERRWSRLTRDGAVLGTPLYMSPEQSSGGVAGPRSDQFSFCVALYEALHGAPPFSLEANGRPRFVELARVRARPGASRPDVPARVESALDRGLRLDPEARFEDMEQLLTALGSEPADLTPAPCVTLELHGHSETIDAHRAGTERDLASTVPGAAPSSADPSPGSSPGGRGREGRGMHIGPFMVLRKLGQGGMGVVYAAYDPELDRRVAIKLLRPKYQGLEALGRLQREAQGLARLSHPNVVQIHQTGEHRDKVFIAMEYVEGQTLGEWCATTPARPWRELLDTFLQAGRGLAAAHAAKLVHRDFKPANVIVGDDGRVRVLDFGLVRDIDPSQIEAAATPERASGGPGPALVTGTGLIVGTPAYMSLEQIEGLRVDARSDQFAFCVAAFEALYGQRPFEGRNICALSLAIRRGRIRPRPADTDVPRRLHEALVRGLSGEPGERWPDMPTLLAELERIADRSRARWVWAIAGAAGGIALLGLVGAPWVQHRLDAKDDRISKQRQHIVDRRREADELAAQRERESLERERERQVELDVQTGLLVQLATRAPGQHLGALLLALETYGHYAPASAPIEVEAAMFAATRGLHRARALVGHEGAVVDFAHAPDGELIATASRDDSVKLWSSHDGRLLGTLSNHTDDVLSVEFSPDGARLLSTSKDGTAVLWRVDTGEELDTVFDVDVSAARLSPSGNELAVGGADGELGIYSITATGELVFDRSLADRGTAIDRIEFSPDGSRLLVVGDALRLWRSDSPEPKLLAAAARSPRTAAFSPDGDRIAAADRAGSLVLWDGEGRKIAALDSEDHRSLSAVAFDPRGRRLVSASRTGAPKIWSAHDGALLTEVEGHPRGAIDAVFSPDGRHVATVSYDTMVRLCDPRTGRIVEIFESDHDAVARVSFAPRGDQIATIGESDSVRVWETKLAAEQVHELAAGRELATLSLSPDRSRAIVVNDDDGRASIWDVGSGQRKSELPHRGGRVLAVAFSPDGRRVGTSDASHQTRVWDVRTGVTVATLAEDPSSIMSLAFAPSGAQLVTGNMLGQVRAWALSEGEGEPELRWQVKVDDSDVAVSALAVSPDGQTIAGGSLSPVVKVWSGTGEELLSLTTPDTVNAVAFSPDGARLASVGEYGELQVWDARSGALLIELRGSETALHRVAFSPDGSRVATGGDRWIQLWDLDARAKIADLAANPSAALDLAFSADDKHVHAAYGSGRIVTVAATAPQCASLACAVLRDVGADANIARSCEGT